MRIDRFEGNHWLAHHHVDLPFAPFTIIAGPNDAGKSAIADGIAFAMLADLRRISAKGDRPMLVTDGHEDGSVAVTCEGVRIERAISSGKMIAAGKLPVPEDATVGAIQYVMDPALFMRAPAEKRRDLLLQLPGLDLDITALRLKAELTKRGHTESRVRFLPDASISDWEKTAREHAAQARGAWKATTGDTYGALKADAWTAPDAGTRESGGLDIAAIRAHATACEKRLAEGQRRAGIAHANAQAHRNITTRHDAIQATLKDGRVLAELAEEALNLRDATTAALESAETRLKAARDHQQGTFLACPHCAGAIVVDDQGVVRGAPRAASLPVTKAALSVALKAHAAAKQECDAAVRTHEDAIKTLRENDQKKSAAAEIGKQLAEMQSVDVDAIMAQTAAAETENQDAQNAVRHAEDLERAAGAAEKATADAATAHEDVKAWTALAIAAGINGVQAEMLAAGMKPLTTILESFAKATGWPNVTLDALMRMRLNGRLYELMSESTKWRADAMMTVAIAMLSRTKFIILDRFDVLDIQKGRGQAVNWLYRLTKDGVLDTVILIGTLRAPPQLPADVTLHWIDPHAPTRIV